MNLGGDFKIVKTKVLTTKTDSGDVEKNVMLLKNDVCSIVISSEVLTLDNVGRIGDKIAVGFRNEQTRLE